MKKILFATGNEDKLHEIRQIAAGIARVQSVREAGISADIAEDGASFEENALIKAKAVHALADPDTIVLADDSGLEIDYLNGAPGIYSARFMGEHTSYDLKNAELLRRLANVPKEKRGARFVCCVAAVLPDGGELLSRGVMEGRIAQKPAGENGFGYDPIFWLDEFGRTSAEIPPEKKNEISHRGKALRQMIRLLEEL